MQYKGIILDFNGTLIWDTLLHKEAWFVFGKEFDIPMNDKLYYNQIHGRATGDILEMLFQRRMDQQESLRLVYFKEACYRQACLDNPDVYRFAPGVEDFLNYITGIDIPRTIATASERDNLDFFIETLALGTWFDTDKFVYDDGTLSIKPAPDVYLLAAERLGLKPSELIVVEDTYYGALAAKRAGAGYIIVTGPEESRHDDLNDLDGVDLFVSDFSEIDRDLFAKSEHVTVAG